MNLPEEYLKERFEMILRLEGKMKVRYTMTKEELETLIIENLQTDSQIETIEFIITKDSNGTPYLSTVEIHCEY